MIYASSKLVSLGGALSTLLLFCCSSSRSTLAEPCTEKGKIYRSLGSLKRNFVDVDSAWLPRLIAISEALPDKWIRYSAESDSLEVRVIDWSTGAGERFTYTFATLHRHILYPAFPKKSQVKLPCSVEVVFENGFARVSGQISIELKIRGGEFRSVYGTWEWDPSTKRIEFTEEGSSLPTIYWDLKK